MRRRLSPLEMRNLECSEREDSNGLLKSIDVSPGPKTWQFFLCDAQWITTSGLWPLRFTLKICGCIKCTLSNGPWKCEVDVFVFLRRCTGEFSSSSSIKKGPRFCFDQNNRSWEDECFFYWSTITSQVFTFNDKITVEFRMRIISSDRGQPEPSMFDAPNRMCDVILKIGEKKLHVCKQYLAVHSPVFETMFFGDFTEKGKEEVELKDVVHEEFLDLLHLIYSNTLRITDGTVPHILKLADQFQMENILNESKMYLTETKGIDVMRKLLIADRYNLTALRDHFLKSFTTAMELKKKLESCPDYANFSERMKAVICDWIVKLR